MKMIVDFIDLDINVIYWENNYFDDKMRCKSTFPFPILTLCFLPHWQCHSFLYSERRKINSRVPQGSVLGPLLFLIDINDMPDGLTSMCKIFAENTSLFQRFLT